MVRRMSGPATSSVLDLLRQSPRLAELAAFPFDFDLDRAEHGEDVRLASGAPLAGVAGDDTGGTYFLCHDGGVLYADSEGCAGLLAESVSDALELVTGLPGWRDHVTLPPETDGDEVTAAAREAEADIRASYAPDLDAHREELLAGLGLARRPPAELFVRMHRALRRTEPEHVLLLADEGTAYHLLDPHSRPSADTAERSGDGSRYETVRTRVRLARSQGLVELARITLIRTLDDIGPADTAELPWVTAEFEAIGDYRQAARAQGLYARLQDDDPARGAAFTRLGGLERQHGDLGSAWASLQRALHVLDGPPPGETDVDQPALFDIPTNSAQDVRPWTDTGVALDLTEEYFRLARSTAEAGRPDLAHRSLAAGAALLDRIPRPAPTASYRAAHAAAVACGDHELAARYAEFEARQE